MRLRTEPSPKAGTRNCKAPSAFDVEKTSRGSKSERNLDTHDLCDDQHFGDQMCFSELGLQGDARGRDRAFEEKDLPRLGFPTSATSSSTAAWDTPSAETLGRMARANGVSKISLFRGGMQRKAFRSLRKVLPSECPPSALPQR